MDNYEHGASQHTMHNYEHGASQHTMHNYEHGAITLHRMIYFIHYAAGILACKIEVK